MKEKILLARFESESKDDVFYDLFREGTKWVCSCPGYTHYGRCKHPEKIRSGNYTREIQLTLVGFLAMPLSKYKVMEHEKEQAEKYFKKVS